MDQKKLIEILQNISILLEIKGENPFKSNAYSNAAQVIINQYIDVEKAVKEDTLKNIKGFGKALQSKITEYVETGKMSYYEKLINEIPESILDIVKLPGLGPKKVKVMYNELNITNINELKSACEKNEISSLKGFSSKTEENILNEIKKTEG